MVFLPLRKHKFMGLDLDQGHNAINKCILKIVGCFMPQRQARQHNYVCTMGSSISVSYVSLHSDVLEIFLTTAKHIPTSGHMLLKIFY